MIDANEQRRLSYKSVSTLDSINEFRAKINMDPIIHKWIDCLGCNREFKSRGRENRLCDKCQHPKKDRF